MNTTTKRAIDKRAKDFSAALKIFYQIADLLSPGPVGRTRELPRLLAEFYRALPPGKRSKIAEGPLPRS
jgi:hypothetical protein